MIADRANIQPPNDEPLPAKVGDIVAYRTKDFYGYQNIMAKVKRVDKFGAHITTIDGVALCVPPHVLTTIKTVWQDTMRDVAVDHPAVVKQVDQADDEIADDPTTYYVIAVGNAFDRIKLYGDPEHNGEPWTNADDAGEFAHQNVRNLDWHVVPVNPAKDNK